MPPKIPPTSNKAERLPADFTETYSPPISATSSKITRRLTTAVDADFRITHEAKKKTNKKIARDIQFQGVIYCQINLGLRVSIKLAASSYGNSV